MSILSTFCAEGMFKFVQQEIFESLEYAEYKKNTSVLPSVIFWQVHNLECIYTVGECGIEIRQLSCPVEVDTGSVPETANLASARVSVVSLSLQRSIWLLLVLVLLNGEAVPLLKSLFFCCNSAMISAHKEERV